MSTGAYFVGRDGGRYRAITCLDCGQEGAHAARGLCWACYRENAKDGTLDDFPAYVAPQVAGRTAEELVKSLTGVTYRQLDHWCRKGYLRPDGGVGSGTVRVFSDEESAVAQVMARLVVAGLLPAAAARVARGEMDLAPGIRIVLEQVAA
jgi:hypothetical protein